MPLVSVVIAYYQHQKYIGETIASLLAQSLTDFEIVVVDDKSTDSGMEIVEAFGDPRIRTLYRSSNGGPSAALNDGIRAARGKYIALTGSDDVSEPWRLEHQLMYLDKRGAGVAFSPPTLIDGDGRELRDQTFPVFFHQPRRESSHAALRSLFLKGNTYCAPTAFMRADVVHNVGPFDERLIQLQDYDYWMRVAAAGYSIFLGERRVVRYRIHGANLSRQTNDERMLGEMMRCHIKMLRSCPPATFAKSFPDVVPPGYREARPLDRAMVAMRHGHKVVQSIGKAMLLELVSNSDPNEEIETSLDDTFIAAAINADLPSDAVLAPEWTAS